MSRGIRLTKHVKLFLEIKTSVSIFWFRRDLRLDDNAGLYHALTSGDPVLPVFVFDKEILDKLENKQDRRVDFIHQQISVIREKLIERGSSLLVIHDTPLNAFKKLISQYQVKAVYTNRDYEPYAIKRDNQVQEYLAEKGIAFKTYKDQVIFEKSEVMKSDGTPYTIFTPYSKVWKQKLNAQSLKSFHSEKQLDSFLKIKPYAFPSLAEIGFKKTDIRFESPVIDKKIIAGYHDTRNIPSINGTTRLSVHLRFGTISIRELATIARQLNEQWLNELIWREFFMSILFHFPEVVTQSFKKKYDGIKWRNHEDEFKSWCEGQTGYPIVDAGMRELNQTGFMHNRVRMIVASFLTKHLLVDWRWGEAYFAEKLLDFELSSNNGNWQWAAGCGCDAAPYFRVFNPAEQVRKFDAGLLYIRKWVPEFEELTYPKPIVEHAVARLRALSVYKQGLQ